MHSRPRGDVHEAGRARVYACVFPLRVHAREDCVHAMTLHLHGRVVAGRASTDVQTVLPVSRSCEELERVVY